MDNQAAPAVVAPAAAVAAPRRRVVRKTMLTTTVFWVRTTLLPDASDQTLDDFAAGITGVFERAIDETPTLGSITSSSAAARNCLTAENVTLDGPAWRRSDPAVADSPMLCIWSLKMRFRSPPGSVDPVDATQTADLVTISNRIRRAVSASALAGGKLGGTCVYSVRRRTNVELPAAASKLVPVYAVAPPAEPPKRPRGRPAVAAPVPPPPPRRLDLAPAPAPAPKKRAPAAKPLPLPPPPAAAAVAPRRGGTRPARRDPTPEPSASESYSEGEDSLEDESGLTELLGSEEGSETGSETGSDYESEESRTPSPSPPRRRHHAASSRTKYTK